VAAYVAPPPNVSGASSSADSAQTDTNTPAASSAAPLPSGSAVLSDDTVAALVAQQAAETASPDSAAAPATDDASSADHVQIPATVLANMKAFETTSPTAYTDQIAQYADTINDAKASDQDRLNAWTTLSGLLTDGKVYKAGNLDDFQKALDATQTSGYAKSLLQMQDQFHARNVMAVDTAKARGQAGTQGMMDALDSYSDADQQKLFVLMGMNQTYSDLATMKADYQNISDIYAKTGQLTKATLQLPAAAGGQAKAAAVSPQAAASPAEPDGAPASSADTGTAVALKTLQTISDQLAAAKKGDDDGSILSLFDRKPTAADGDASSTADDASKPKADAAA
jgi:hypothetical protein